MPTTKNYKWSCYLNPEENSNAERLLEYLWKNRCLEKKTPYALTKYMISLGVDMMDKELEQMNMKEEIITEEVL